MEHKHDEHSHSHGKHNTSIEELIALMKYMVGHNTSHNEELKELAEELKKHGRMDAYLELMEAIRNYDLGNEKLKSALEKVNG